MAEPNGNQIPGVAPFFPFFGQGFPLKVKQPPKNAPFFHGHWASVFCSIAIVLVLFKCGFPIPKGTWSWCLLVCALFGATYVGSLNKTNPYWRGSLQLESVIFGSLLMGSLSTPTKSGVVFILRNTVLALAGFRHPLAQPCSTPRVTTRFGYKQTIPGAKNMYSFKGGLPFDFRPFPMPRAHK